jgi:CheY-like chemotaxis protein
VHGIVTSLNGDIGVQSEPGQKTTFQILLPVYKTTKETAPQKVIQPFKTGNENILLVDDDKIVVQFHKKAIESLGYTVTAFSNSLEALDRFQKMPDSFDLVITDMTMPDMTGGQLAEQILEIKPDMPIILLTGYSDQLNQEQAKTIGIQGYLTKPVLQRVLANSIRNTLDENK